MVLPVALLGCSEQASEITESARLALTSSGAAFSVSNVGRKTYAITRAPAKAVAGGSSLPVRGKTPALSGTSITPLTLAPITSSGTKGLSTSLFKTLSGQQAGAKDQAKVWAVSYNDHSMWMDKVSGSWLYANASRAGSGPATVGLAQDAVEVALQLVGQHTLLSLASGESLDILSVGRVRGAMIDKTTHKPVLAAYLGQPPAKSHVVEYSVRFGRRINGVPVFNSELAVRMNPNGKLLGVKKHWRALQGAAQGVSMDTTDLEKRVTAVCKQKGLPAVDKVVSLACGYVEAPRGEAQATLLPGCHARYRSAGHAHELSVYLPLVTGGGPLWGTAP